MSATPVGDDNAVEAPLAFENLIQQAVVVAGVLAVEVVVCTHNRPATTLLNGCLEGGEVDFIQSTVVQYRLGGVAVGLLIVQCVVFYAGGNAIFLHLLHIGDNHLGSQIGVFAHIFEVATIQRTTIDVYARAE